MVEFYTYGLCCTFECSLLAEISPTSMVVTSTDFLIFRLFSENKIVLLMEYVVYIFLAFFVMQEIVKVSMDQRLFFLFCN